MTDRSEPSELSHQVYSQLMFFHHVTPLRAYLNASTPTRPDPTDVNGAERAFRLNSAFQIENSNGVLGVLPIVRIWQQAQELDEDQLDKFRVRVGFNQPKGLFDFREELLIDIASRIEALQDELGSELTIWATVLLAARPQRGGTASLLADLKKCREQNTVLGILECLVSENMRREMERQEK